MLTLAAAHALVPPLRGCALCRHSTAGSAGLLCTHPAIATACSPKPVHIVRDVGGECGPQAHHMHMPSWGRELTT